MFKLILLLFLFAYEARCESEYSMTTVLPNYSADQVEDEIIPAGEVKSPIEEIRVEGPAHNVVQAPKEIKQMYIDDLSQQMNVEMLTNAPEITTILPTVQRVKRAPRYTIREILYPNGIMHEVGHLRDHAVNRLAKGVNRRLPNSIANRLANLSSRRVMIHHKYHHIPNHLAYLPVVGPFLGERKA